MKNTYFDDITHGKENKLHRGKMIFDSQVPNDEATIEYNKLLNKQSTVREGFINLAKAIYMYGVIDEDESFINSDWGKTIKDLAEC